MKRAFIPFIEAYNESGGNPAEMDLESLSDKLGGRYELYIIDDNNIVAYTTNRIDLGLNFSTLDGFSRYLDEIRAGDSFVGDRVSKGVRDTGNIQKYAYLPTPDDKYILELSYAIKKEDARFLLKYGNTVDELQPLNPYLESVHLYEILGNIIGDKDESLPGMKELVKREVIEKKSDYIIRDAEAGRVTVIRYVDLSHPGEGADMSLAVAFTYNQRMLENQINSIILFQLGIYMVFFTLFFAFLILMARAVTKPIKDLVDDVDTIAGGDYDHEIRSSGVKEFAQLEESITNMVEKIVGSLNEKTVLLHEVHDRVKNNLQIISGIIQLQSRSIEDEAAKEALLMCENRIRALSSVHDTLYRTKDLSLISSKEHFNTLALDIMQSVGSPEGCRIDLDIDIEDHNLSPDTAIPLSLVINEILSNSLKYAFAGREKGTIGMRFRSADGGFHLEIWDNGIGLPEDYETKRPGSLGLKLVKRLVRDQLKGELTIKTEKGTRFYIDLPENNGEKV